MKEINCFESVERQYLKIIGKALEEIKEIRMSKVLLGIIKDEHELKVARESIERINKNLKQIQEAKGKIKSNQKDIRLNFYLFSDASLKQLRIDVKAMRDVLTHRVNSGFYTNQHDEDLARREIHSINKVLGKIDEGISKNRKRREYKAKMGNPEWV